MSLVDQLSGNLGQSGAANGGSIALGVCCMKGCGKVANIDTEIGVYCLRCWEELVALQELDRRNQEKRRECCLKKATRRNAVRRVWRWIVGWSWIPNLVFVIAMWVYLVIIYGCVFADWIQRGEWR